MARLQACDLCKNEEVECDGCDAKWAAIAEANKAETRAKELRWRRERIATAVLAGVASQWGLDPIAAIGATQALKAADALIAELDKPRG